MSGLSLPLTLSPGDQKTFSVDFAPTVTGLAAGQILFTSNAANPTAQVILSGAGVNPHSAKLNWTASPSSGVVGYNVYRGSVSGGPYALLNTTLAADTNYEDASVQAGETYYYVTTAVNSQHAESVYSNQAQAVIPFP